MANFTEKAIVETLNRMLKTKAIDKITIKELTQECGISRNTFYYHFHDIYEVLTKSFVEKTDEVLRAHQMNASWEESLIQELNFLYENKTAIDHIYWSVDGDALDKFLDKVVYNYVRGVIEEESAGHGYRESTISIAADFYKNALLGAVLGWIEDGMKKKPEELAHLYNSIFEGTKTSLLSSIEQAE